MEIKTRFQLVDLSLSMFIFTPLVVLFWHGNFGILDILILKNNPVAGPWIIVFAGILIQVLMCYYQHDIEAMVTNRAQHRLYIMFYNYVMASGQVIQFRGLNDLYEYFMDVGVYDAITATCTAIVILFGSKISSQVTDMPLALTLDTDLSVTNAFRLDTYYNTEPKKDITHLLDIICTYGLMQTFVHVFSIAAWVAVDSGFFPSNAALAMMSSWFFGHGLLLVLLYDMPRLQQLSRDALDSESPFIGTVFVNILLIAEGLGVVMSWHGHWVLYDVLKYYFPIYHAETDVTPFYEVLIAFSVLALCQISSVLVRRGIASDEAYNTVDSLNFTGNYLSQYYKEEIQGIEVKDNAQEDIAGENNVIDQPPPSRIRPKLNMLNKPKGTEDGPIISRRAVTLQDLVESDKKKRESKKSK